MRFRPTTSERAPPRHAAATDRRASPAGAGSVALAAALLIAFAAGGNAAAGERIGMLVQRSPLAGSQYYALSSVWLEIRPGDRLSLVREPDNRHDPHAIRVEWNGRQLGYVPRSENRALAAAMDRGEAVEARVTRLRKHRDPWQRVEFEVDLLL
ncbi:MAG TPA: HIRAN domain-containing protein [Azospira sp.]|nr:HIRAN domain-containing protein [Azospira sp.]